MPEFRRDLGERNDKVQELIRGMTDGKVKDDFQGCGLCIKENFELLDLFLVFLFLIFISCNHNWYYYILINILISKKILICQFNQKYICLCCQFKCIVVILFCLFFFLIIYFYSLLLFRQRSSPSCLGIFCYAFSISGRHQTLMP